MPRTVKAPEDRRKELMMAASELFMNKGYEETSVNSIIEKVGVAKGTFYHYFTSKEEILEAILASSMESASLKLTALCERKDLSAAEKLQHVLTGITLPSYHEEKLSSNVKDQKDDKIHMALENKLFQVFYPIILSVIKEGIESKEFKINYPEEITEIITIGVQGFMHNNIRFFKKKENAAVKLAALEELFTKVLGYSKGEFKFLI